MLVIYMLNFFLDFFTINYESNTLSNLIYASQIYGTAKTPIILKFQKFHSKVSLQITNAPCYVSNNTLHRDLNVS